MKSIAASVLLSSFLVVANAAHPQGASTSEPIYLWPQGAPGEKGDIGKEADTTKPGDHEVAGKAVVRLGNVSQPTITVYPAPADKNTGAAVLVCPGGAYHILAMDLEGTEVVDWLNSIGVTGVLLKYRVPARHGRERYEAPLQDAQRALSLVRHQADRWGIDPRRIGVMGFSAGGHLSAVLSNQYNKRAYDQVDAADEASCRPDFVMLVYPAYLTASHENDQIAPELPVTAKTPPTFLVQTEDDPVRVESSIYYYLALKNAGVPAEMHIFAKGGHGYGLRRTEQAVTRWPRLAQRWLRGLGVLKAN